MRLLLLTAYFPPDNGSAAHLFYELGTAFRDRGHQVTVITQLPGYHASGDLKPYRRKLWVRERIAGIKVVRVFVPVPPRRLMIGRALWQFSCAITFLAAALLTRRHDAVVVYSPPLPLGLTAWVLRLTKRSPYILNIQDLFPQSIIDLGLLRNRLAIRVFELMERFCYKVADRVTVHSPGNRDHILRKGGRPERTIVIPNAVDTEFIKPGPRLNGFRKEHGLGNNDFVLSFAGVIGYSQDIDVILEAAKQLNERVTGGQAPITWLIVGDGVEKDRLQKKAVDFALRNVLFLPMQSREKYPSILHASDVCLCTLHADVRTPVVPSKILSIMAAGRPVIVAMNPGDATFLIQEAGCGVCVPPEEPVALAQAVWRLYKDPAKAETMGECGRRYADEHLSLGVFASRYEELARNLKL
ncbi:MAG: glycosyltransferase family 4 protein [Acidobacteriota bacterium]